MRAREKARTSSPRNLTSPEVGSINRRMQRPVVVFPLPDSPTRPNVSPSNTSNVTRSTARTVEPPPNRPLLRVNSFVRFRTSRSGADISSLPSRARAGSTSRSEVPPEGGSYRTVGPSYLVLRCGFRLQPEVQRPYPLGGQRCTVRTAADTLG